MNLTIRHASALRGETHVPGDKSITHRALLLGALSNGSSRIKGYLDGGDCRATMDCLLALGVPIEERGIDELVVQGRGPFGWQEPNRILDCVRSGTTMRLMAGCLAGQSFYSVLMGSEQLNRRPMDRVTTPLRQMGARIWGRQSGRLPPLSIIGSQLQGIDYALPMASAQVKSCVLLAGLYAAGRTTVIEPGPSRDHTERMLTARGAVVESPGLQHTLLGPVDHLAALDTVVPGDFSSAAFFIAGACLLPHSEITLWNIGVNPTRTGLLEILRQMGAEIVTMNERDQGGEPVADLWIRAKSLKGVEVGGAIVPRMIDEFPILALAATQAEGVTRVRDAAELRLKETDRIATTVETLRTLGASIEERPDGFDVEGPTPLRGARVESGGDHRLALTLAIAGLVARDETIIGQAECIPDSFPEFEACLDALVGGA
ncbi:MAG: 3-phosphoshikimate 1-carboxyvinyltransferase [Anaerolineae bacterium]|nr:3-phosphoshikimate 1-carboxyvinyltransferase [Anaerolineae bacterium]